MGSMTGSNGHQASQVPVHNKKSQEDAASTTGNASLRHYYELLRDYGCFRTIWIGEVI